MALKNLIGILIVILLIIVPVLFTFIADYIWFLSISMEPVFLTILFTSLYLGLAAGLIFLIFSFLNIKIAQKRSKKSQLFKFVYLFAALISLIIGLTFSSRWEVVLKYLNSTKFNVLDPLFSMDVSFFVFELPFLGLVFSYIASLLVLTLVVTFISYLVNQKPAAKIEDKEIVDEIPIPQIDFSVMKKKSVPHLSILLALIFFTLSFGFMLAQWSLVLSPTGAVFGASYTDVNFTLPLLTILSVITVVIGLLFLANIKFNRWRLPVEGIVAFILILIIGFAVTGIVQAFIVEPDEFNLEKPFIEKNIKSTLEAYNIEDIEISDFPVSYNLSKQDIEANSGTIGNIRLWDFRPLMETYNQLQLFRTYYEFNDVDIDRYDIDGEYKQVMVSAREIDTNDLPSQAQTWINKHLVYTHGYGVVMNPVDKVTTEGLPEFIIQDIPPKSQSISLSRNEIYFGDGNLDYAIVKTTTEELDYPIGDENVYTTYQGQSGITMDPFNRLVYAIKYRSPEILFSNSIQPESKILIKRNVVERVKSIAPFLIFDNDPYVVVADEKLYWIIDAYTTSSSYPYSEPFSLGFLQDINYVRNSVKVIVNAYTGQATFYLIEDQDPVIQTYQKIFPELFTAFDNISPELKKHIRYPEGMFIIQSEIYSTYHMNDPRVFYNREDVWVRPDEVYRGSRQQILPYYIIMKLPGEEKEEFTLILPFVPRGKDNLIGWMAARSDYPNYGKLVVFSFSKQELIYGPLQIEARIDQDTDISALFTLWSQAGSSVIRGNTLVIPVKDSILYIEPVFLEATEKGTLPQLKRVIVAYGNKLTMQTTLQEAIDTIFGMVDEEPVIILPEGTPEQVLEQVAELFDKAQESLKETDFQSYGLYMNQIKEILINY